MATAPSDAACAPRRRRLWPPCGLERREGASRRQTLPYPNPAASRQCPRALPSRHPPVLARRPALLAPCPDAAGARHRPPPVVTDQDLAGRLPAAMRHAQVREVPPVRDALHRVRRLALERGHGTGSLGDNEIADTLAGRGHCSPLTCRAGAAGVSLAGAERQEIVGAGTLGSPARRMYGQTMFASFSRPARQPNMWA